MARQNRGQLGYGPRFGVHLTPRRRRFQPAIMPERAAIVPAGFGEASPICQVVPDRRRLPELAPTGAADKPP
jgi:hypothetical protein